MNKWSLLLLAFATVGIPTQSYAMEEENFNTTKKTISIAPYQEPIAKRLINFIKTHDQKTIKASRQIDPTNNRACYLLHADGGEHHPAGDVISFYPEEVIRVIQMEKNKKSFSVQIEKDSDLYEFFE